MIHQRRNFRVGVHLDKPATELVAFTNLNQVSVILSGCHAFLQQLFEHDGDFDAVGGGQGVELQRVFTDRECFIVGGACYRAIDIGKFTAIARFPFPNTRWGIGVIAHWFLAINRLSVIAGVGMKRFFR